MIIIDAFCDRVTERDGTQHEDRLPLELVNQRNVEGCKRFLCADVVTFEVIWSSAKFRNEGI